MSRIFCFAAAGLVCVAMAPGAASALRMARAHPPAVPGPAVDEALAKILPGKVVEVVGVPKDCTVLSYMPAWNQGNVDWVGVANNNGGVRTLIGLPAIPAEVLAPEGRKVFLALYSEKTTTGGESSAIDLYGLRSDWPERTSWTTRPESAVKPFAREEFAGGEGWKIFNVTAIARASTQTRGTGVMLRFAEEDRRNDWSGYSFVSRDATGEKAARKPLLLVVEPSK